MRIALRRWIPIVLCLVGTLGGALIYIQTTSPTYESSVRLFVNVAARDTVQESVAGVQLTGNLLSSYVEVIESDLGAEVMRRELGLAPGTALPGEISASVETNTLLIRIEAASATPERAQRLADAAGSSLVQILEDAGSGSGPGFEAEVIDRAGRPTSPTSPNTSRSLLLAVLGGLVLGVAAASLLEALDRQVRTPADARHAVPARMVASLPRSPRLRRTPLVATRGVLADAEPYRSLRTALTAQLDLTRGNTIVVTSASPGEGKTTTAANLAVVCAQAGMRTCLVDADLRNPRVHELFDLPREPGLVEILLDVPGARDSRPACFGVDVVPAGSWIGNPSEMLNSQGMADLLDHLASRYDLVLIDTPPVLPVTDAAVLARGADGVLLVVAHAQTTRGELEKAGQLLAAVGVSPLGLVYNGAVGDADEVAYGYGYGQPVGR